MLSRLSAKRWLVSAVALSATALTLHAQPGKNHNKHDLRAEVEIVDRQWRSAELASDTTAMEKLLSDDYIGVTAGGRVVTKPQQLERMRNRQSEIRRLEFSDIKIKLVGGAAIVTSMAQLDATMDGRPMYGQFRSIRVYQRVPGGAWKLVNFEATPVRSGEVLSPAPEGR